MAMELTTLTKVCIVTFFFSIICLTILDLDSFKFKFEKAEKGKRFEGLDLITKMLTPNTAASKGAASRPLIEELDADDQGILLL